MRQAQVRATQVFDDEEYDGKTPAAVPTQLLPVPARFHQAHRTNYLDAADDELLEIGGAAARPGQEAQGPDQAPVAASPVNDGVRAKV